MKVTVVCDVMGEENNGTTVAAANLVRSLVEKGHTVNILCPGAENIDGARLFTVPVCNFGPLNGYVRKNGVQLAKADDTVILKSMDGADIVHVMMPFSLGKRAAVLARRQIIPLSAGFHVMAENVTTHVFMQDFPLANRLTYQSFSRLYRQCRAIHYPTQYLRDLYEGMYGPTNGYVISNGVSEGFRPRTCERPEEYKDRYVVVFTGRYSREKSHALLIDAAAMSRHRDKLQLVFAGTGPLEGELRRRAAKLPVQPVFSFFSREEMTRLLNYADLYVHPAEVEAEGIACLEAISCGLVPVISDSPRCATQAYALDNKCLFRYDSPADLAGRMDWWLDHPAERAACGRKYADFARGRFDRSSCMDQMEEMLLRTAGLEGYAP